MVGGLLRLVRGIVSVSEMSQRAHNGVFIDVSCMAKVYT